MLVDRIDTPSDDDPMVRARKHRRALLVVCLRSSAAVVGMVVVYFLAPLGGGEPGSVLLRSVLSVVLLLAVVTGQTIAVLKSSTPTLRAIEAVAVSLALLLVTAAATYLVISGVDAEAFTEPLDHVGALYLSMMTMTTVGFGDIGALSSPARVAVMVQLVLNALVLGVALRVMFRRVDR